MILNNHCQEKSKTSHLNSNLGFQYFARIHYVPKTSIFPRSTYAKILAETDGADCIRAIDIDAMKLFAEL